MKAYVCTRKDDKMEKLLFVSSEFAQNFISFVEMYQYESGAGNGYGAYWIYEKNIVRTSGRSNSFVRTLEFDRIQGMATDIARARSGGGVVTMPSIKYGIDRSAICFAFWGFDCKNKPKPGDMYRVVDWNIIQDDFDERFGEGRVRRVEGGNIVVVNCYDEFRSIRNQVELEEYLIPHSAVMKIPDWLAEHHR